MGDRVQGRPPLHRHVWHRLLGSRPRPRRAGIRALSRLLGPGSHGRGGAGRDLLWLSKDEPESHRGSLHGGECRLRTRHGEGRDDPRGHDETAGSHQRRLPGYGALRDLEGRVPRTLLKVGDGRDDLLAEGLEWFYLVDVRHVEDEVLYAGFVQLAA